MSGEPSLSLDMMPPFLLLVDVQTRILRGIPNAPSLLQRACFLVDAAHLLDLPIAATAQVPEKLGPLDEQLTHRIASLGEPIPKQAFSAAPSIQSLLQPGQPIWVCGIETHICLRQTVLDLIQAGHSCKVIADAAGARGRLDHDLALQELSVAGATVSTAETVVYEQCRTAAHPRFRELTALVRELGEA